MRTEGVNRKDTNERNAKLTVGVEHLILRFDRPAFSK
jgi:hypothetical protein